MSDLRITRLVCNDEQVEYIVGQKGVAEIKEHAAQGDGDRWFYDITFSSNKQVVREFNPDTVVWEESE